MRHPAERRDPYAVSSRFSAGGRDLPHPPALVKQLGFYVDLDDQMRVRSTPSQVTPELAKDHLDFARDVLETLRSHLPTASSPLPRREP
jgi:hypothetical protein